MRNLIQILGAGPAGLAAAHAAILAARTGSEGVMPMLAIYTTRRGPSPLHGAQYLHEPIPELGLVSLGLSVQVRYELRGSAQSYRDKVYGEGWYGAVSPEDLPEEHPAWDIRETYLALWSRYNRFITVVPPISPHDMPLILREGALTISTVPAAALCAGYNVLRPKSNGILSPHNFAEQTIYAVGQRENAGDGDYPLSQIDCPENTVICNGEPEPAWYRISNIFGRKTVEWSEQHRPPINAARVHKPLVTNCDCWMSENYLRAGRYGRWEKGILVHDAFNAAYDWVKERL